MQWISRPDVVLWLFGAYVAVMALVRMMRRRRDAVVADVQRQLAAHRSHRKKHRRRPVEHKDSSAA